MPPVQSGRAASAADLRGRSQARPARPRGDGDGLGAALVRQLGYDRLEAERRMLGSKIDSVTKWAAALDPVLGEPDLVNQTTEPCTIRAVGSGIHGNFPVRVLNRRGSEKPSRSIGDRGISYYNFDIVVVRVLILQIY